MAMLRFVIRRSCYMYRVLIVIFLLYLNKIGGVSYYCPEPGMRCYYGYQWNAETKSCIRCMPGYHGPNCTYPCPYPDYGLDCQFVCECYRHSCDHVIGCTTPTTEMVRICPPGYFGSLCRAKCIYIHRMARNVKKCVIVVKIHATSQLDVRKKRKRVLLDILDTCVERSVYIIIMVRSVKVTAIVVKTCVTSHMDANPLLKIPRVSQHLSECEQTCSV
ncbi:uncharacterized protein LOC144620925 [Crassostrea virginica]